MAFMEVLVILYNQTGWYVTWFIFVTFLSYMLSYSASQNSPNQYRAMIIEDVNCLKDNKSVFYFTKSKLSFYPSLNLKLNPNYYLKFTL